MFFKERFLAYSQVSIDSSTFSLDELFSSKLNVLFRKLDK
jgi:hypothetical protein